MDRRDFLKTSLVGAGVAAGLGTLGLPAGAVRAADADAPPTDRPKAELKLCAQHWLVPGKSLAEKAEKILKWGGKGIELGPGDIVDTKKRDEVKAMLANSPIKIAAICAADGPYIVPDEAERQKKIDNAKRILDAAGEVGSTGVIMVPAFNGAKTQL
jgi:sugar phosphate isomerase/epimerase